MPQKTIIWKGRDEHATREHCTLVTYTDAIEVNSTVIGLLDNIPFRTEYHLEITPDWHVTAVHISSTLSSAISSVNYTSNGKGNWFNGEEPEPGLAGCTTIDISVTPFTNTLAIKALQLEFGDTRRIKVLYFDIIAQQIKPVEQVYTRIGDSTYRFETNDGDFKADIILDKDGLVSDYPGLFEKVY